jgi:LuxR family maltose regulon positive regulatory protein
MSGEQQDHFFGSCPGYVSVSARATESGVAQTARFIDYLQVFLLFASTQTWRNDLGGFMTQNRASALAKLTRPRLHNAVHRERLFTRLEEECERLSALCVVGPPGAGKTTLVASWLDARNLRGIWYQVDPGDSDLATFFFYLRLAATAFDSKGQRPLPLLTPEFLPDIDGFARRFFRELFSRLPHGATLVLDNYQEVPADQRFHSLVAQSIDEIPPGISLIAISRRDPPDCYARLIANENVSFIQWEELKLTLPEAVAISAKRKVLNDEEFGALYRASDGWAAGLTLMLERLKSDDIAPHAVEAQTREGVFNYFSGVIFDRLPANVQKVALTTALLPQVTARSAELISGQRDAMHFLEQLYRERHFTDRRMLGTSTDGHNSIGAAPVAAYQYHPLFRAFLLERARLTWSPSEHLQFCLTAASLLEADGLPDDAVALYVEHAQWNRAAKLITSQASRLIAQGRWQTLQSWLQRIPDDLINETPWLLYWWGISLLAVNQHDARQLLERAYSLMRMSGDIVGQLQSAAGVIDSHYYLWASFTAMDRWIEAIQALMQADPVFGSVEAELNVQSSLLIALSYRQPGNLLLADCVARVTALLETDAAVNHRVRAGTFLLGYCYFAAEYELAKQVIAAVEPLMAHPDVTSLNRLWWRARVGYHAYHIADYPGALQALDEAAGISRNHGLAGLHSAEPLLAYFRALVALANRNWGASHEYISILRRLAKPQRRFDMWYLQFAESVVALMENEITRSLEMAQKSIRTALDMGMVYTHQLSLTLTAHVLAHRGRYDEALEVASQAKVLVDQTVIHNMATEAIFVEVYVASRRGDHEQAVQLVRNAFERSQKNHYSFWFRFMPDILPEACAIALSESIETPYVIEVVRRYEIAPPAVNTKRWPWPLRITTLGSFGIFKQGISMPLSKNATGKPMELLKAIIALGICDVSVDTLIDYLWPDAEGDAAQKAFGITLHRLRKQLGYERALVLKGGRIAIDLHLVWIDVASFEHVTREDPKRGMPMTEALTDVVGELKELYRGRFLQTDGSKPWILVSRQRLHTRFLEFVAGLGTTLEDGGDSERSAALYRHAIEIDSCAEPLYRRLMQCYKQAGSIGDAREVYRRCCEALSAAGIHGPSPETKALYQSLQ